MVCMFSDDPFCFDWFNIVFGIQCKFLRMNFGFYQKIEN